MKKCVKCGELRENDRFCREKRVVDGLTAKCRKCRSEEQHNYKKTEKGKEWWENYYKKNSEKIRKKMKDVYNTGKEFKCIFCGKIFNRRVFSSIAANTKYCSSDCMYAHSKILRKGSGNPAYRNGNRTAGKSDVDSKAKRACANYKDKVVESKGYIFCEHCNKSKSLRFEVHHIHYRSEKPNHVNLHNHKNLVLLCIECHNYFHSVKRRRIELKKFEEAKSLF